MERTSLAEEQAALRRVATLVAEQPSPDEVFAAVTEVVGPLLGADMAAMHVFPGDETATTIAGWSATSEILPVGSRLPLDVDSVVARIFHAATAARIDTYAGVGGEAAEVARRFRLRSTVGAPILVRGKLWGALTAATRGNEPFPDNAEQRIATFTELVATAIANADSRLELDRIVAEQQALRAAATMVASGAPQHEVFAAITVAASEVFAVTFSSLIRIGRYETATMVASCPACSAYVGTSWVVPSGDPGITRAVLDSSRPARIEDHSRVQGPLGEAARALGIGSVVGAPVIVEGEVWGVLAVGAAKEGPPLPVDAGERLIRLTELISTAIANDDTQEKMAVLLAEQAALRRVAMLVASEASADELFSAVSDEVAQLLGSGGAAIGRFDPDGPAVIPVGLSKSLKSIPVGMRIDLDDSLACTAVYRTGRTARKDARGEDVYASGAMGDMLRELGLYSSVAAPIKVAGNIWGAFITLSRDMSLPPETEERLEKFSDLVATAIANAESRSELAAAESHARGLADEQAALRRVATLVARGVSPEELFAAVSTEVASLFSTEIATVGRFEPSEPAELTAVGVSEGLHDHLRGVRTPLVDWLASTVVYHTGHTARKEVTAAQVTGDGALPEAIRAMGFLSTVSAPILVEGELWGVLTASSTQESLPSDAEQRVESFAELVATAIANAQSRGELAASESRARELAEEQAALRRVATLVAQGVAPGAIFSAVSEEVERLFRLNLRSTIAAADVIKFEGEESVIVGVARGQKTVPLGSRYGPDDVYSSTRVLRTGRSARVSLGGLASAGGSDEEFVRDVGYLSQVATPIVVEGRIWGVITMNAEEELPAGTEERLKKFTELVATAIANAASRGELASSEARAHELAEEQAALRRVATLVAQGATSERLFSAVAQEAAGVLDIPVIAVQRLETDGGLTMVGVAGDTSFVAGSRWPVDPDSMSGKIFATGRPARRDDYSTMPGPVGDAIREDQMTSTLGMPIVVEGEIWGLLVGGGKRGKPIPEDAEERLGRFTELVATAVSNATTRAELLASRARVVGAADETRRRLERDLHDGIQQWLVALALKARKAGRLATAGSPVSRELSGLADDLVAVTDELREISRGIHPAILTECGLDDALRALARRSSIRVNLDVDFQRRYDPTLEATVYYVVAEAITNVAKHAQASSAEVRGGFRDGVIEFQISDDGVGGANPDRGTGMVGLRDRIEAVGGTLFFASPAGGGTTIRATLPVRPADGDDQLLNRPVDARSAQPSG